MQNDYEALITDASSSLDSVDGTLIELGSQVNKNIHIFRGKFNFGKLFMEKSPQNVIKIAQKGKKMPKISENKKNLLTGY